MISDAIIISEKNWKFAKEIRPKVKKNDIVLIGGGSGTTKSETAYTLQYELYDYGLQSLVISLDDFYYVTPSIRHYNRKKQGLESVGLSEIDWNAVKEICKQFKKKKPIKFRRVHRFLNEVEHGEINSEEINILIIEGLFANYLRKFKLGNVSAYLEGNPQQTLAFRQLRKKENEEDTFRQQVVQREFKVVSQLKKYATIIIPWE
jgi:uridine kinase